jgi:hypothetical protein
VHVTDRQKSDLGSITWRSRLQAVSLLRATALTLGLLMPASLIAAALNDANEDLIVNADGGGSIETIENIRITTLRNNVRIQQGLVTIYGDTAKLEENVTTGELIRVIVEGQPARFVRAAELSSDIINGSSRQIIYYNEAPPANSASTELLSVVEFVGEANFLRGRTALECVEIKHIVETGATDSPGPCVGVFAPASSAEQPSPGEPTTETTIE